MIFHDSKNDVKKHGKTQYVFRFKESSWITTFLWWLILYLDRDPMVRFKVEFALFLSWFSPPLTLVIGKCVIHIFSCYISYVNIHTFNFLKLQRENSSKSPNQIKHYEVTSFFSWMKLPLWDVVFRHIYSIRLKKHNLSHINMVLMCSLKLIMITPLRS